MHVEVLGTWPAIVGTRKEEERWKEEEWSMKGEDSRAI